jgi:peroxiredoxin
MFGRGGYNYQRFERNRLLKDFAVNAFGGAPSPGDRAPDFSGQTLDGEAVRLKNYRGKKNVVLTFGSATCPQTAASLPGLQKLYNDRNEDTEFLFVYTREAHPGERLPAHNSWEDKRRAAELFREEEEVSIPVLVDDVSGKIHRNYGKLPNPTFLIDKSGHVAFRSVASRASVLARAIEELNQKQAAGEKHPIVQGGEDVSLPSPQLLLRARRALDRGGKSSIRNFKREMGIPGRLILLSASLPSPATVAGIGAVVLVLAAGTWTGLALRRKRLSTTYHDPYEQRRRLRDRLRESGRNDYEAVGI